MNLPWFSQEEALESYLALHLSPLDYLGMDILSLSFLIQWQGLILFLDCGENLCLAHTGAQKFYCIFFCSSLHSKWFFFFCTSPCNLFETLLKIAFLKIYLFMRCLSIFRSYLLAIYFMDEKWDGESRWLRVETERPELSWHLFSLESFHFNFICSFKPGCHSHACDQTC